MTVRTVHTMNHQNNRRPQVCIISILIRKVQAVVKKLDEIKVKREDLKLARRELAGLFEEIDSEILKSGIVENLSSDDE